MSRGRFPLDRRSEVAVGQDLCSRRPFIIAERTAVLANHIELIL
jgi:hypothetical protein